jgi:Fe2+ transport system protein FeoA
VLKAKGERRKVLARAVRNLLELQKRLAETRKRKAAVDSEMTAKAMLAAIEISGGISENTVIKIGSRSKKIGTEAAHLRDVRFALGKDEAGETRLRMKAA